jgi:uncharacterized protein YjbI with pentapeptide repeats
MAQVKLEPTDIMDLSGQPTGRKWPANLTNTNLKEAVLEQASMTLANLRDACLDGANLTKADLSDAVTEGASFDGANLSGAKLPE